MARRVNKKFLIILTLIVMGGVGVAIVFPWVLNRSKAAQYVTEGDRCFKEGKYKEAREAYSIAIAKSRPTPDLYVKLGDVFHELARFDDDAIDKDVRYWEWALDMDPSFRAANDRLFQAALDRVDINPVAGSYEWLRQKSEGILKIEPDNAHAQVMTQGCVIGAWLAGKATSDADLKKATDALNDLRAAHPEIWEIPHYLAQADLRQMQDRAGAGDMVKAKELRDSALAIYDDAIKAQPDNAAILIRCYKFKDNLSRMGAMEPVKYDDLLARAKSLVGPDDKEPKQYTDYVAAEIQKAGELQQQANTADAEATLKGLLVDHLLVRANAHVKPDDKDYTEIRLQMARLLQQDQKLPEAEKLLRDLMAERPNDENVRLALAGMLRNLADAKQNSRRPEAIALLSNPMGDDPNLSGFRAHLKKLLEFKRQTELAMVLWDTYATAGADTAKQVRDDLKAQIKSCYDHAQALISESDPRYGPTLLILRGKLLLLENDHQSTWEAIKCLQQALDKQKEAHTADGTLMLLLSNVYRRVGQTGKAIELLEDVVKYYPGALGARKDLTALLLDTGQAEEAKPHVEFLSKVLQKDDEDLIRYRVILAYYLNKASPSAALQKQCQDALADLPEKTPDQQMRKARIALAIGELQTAEKLLVPLSNDELKNATDTFPASELLSRLYFSQGKDNPDDDPAKRAAAAAKRAEAQRIAAACLAKKPDDPTFGLLAKLFSGNLTKEEIARFQDDLIGTTADPVERALQRYQLLRKQAKPDDALDDALKVLLDAETQTNGAGAILETIFNHALETKKWDLAKAYADKLGKLNWDDADGLYYRTRMLLTQNEDLGGATDAQLKEKRQAALNSAEALTRQIPQISKSWLLLGQAQQALGQVDAAIVSYGKVRDSELYNSQALRGLIECYLTKHRLDLALKVIDEGKHGDAPATFVEIEKRVREQTLDAANEDSSAAFLDVTKQREKDLNDRAKDVANRMAELQSKADALKAEGKDPQALAQVTQDLAQLAQDPTLLKYYVALIDNYNRYITVEGIAASKDYAQKSRTRIDEALKRWPDELAVYARLRDLCDLTGQRDDAIAAVKQVLTHEKWAGSSQPLILLGSIYQRMGSKYLADAEQAYQQAVVAGKADKDPNVYLFVRQQLTRFYLQSKQVDKAVALLTQLGDETKDLGYTRQVIQVLLSNNRAEEAEKVLNTALAANPTDAPLLSLMTSVKISRREYDGPGGAGELVDKLLKADPDNAGALCYRGMIHMGLGELKEAQADLEHANNLSPGNPDILLQLANVYIQRHQSDDAIQRLESVVRLAPSDRAARLRLLQLYREQVPPRWAAIENTLNDTQSDPELRKDVGWLKLQSDMWIARGDYQKAIDSLQEAAKRDPGNEDVGYALLDLLLKLKQYDAVLTMIDGVPTADRRWWVHMDRGAALVGKSGKSKEAEDEFDLALAGVDKAEDDTGAANLVETMANVLGLQAASDKITARVAPRWLMQRAVLYLTRHDWAAAAIAADQLLKEGFPRYSPSQRLAALKTAGQIYIAAAAAGVPEASKRGEQAYKDYLDEVQKQRLGIATQLEALNNIAYLFAEQTKPPDYAKALVYSQKAYDLMNRATFFDPNIGDTHGWVLVLANRVDEGMKILQKVVSAEAPPPDAYYHLGRAYLIKSQPDDAQANFQKALDIIETKTKKNPPEFVDPSLKERITKAQEEARQMKPAIGEAR